MTVASDAAWRAEMEATLPAMRAAGGGCLNVYAIRPHDARSLMQAALLGDEAARLMRLVFETVGKITAAPRRRPMLCGVCPRPLRSDEFAVVAAVPAADSPAQALCFGVCLRCGDTPASLNASAFKALRKIWPESRSFVPTHADGGRA